MYENSLDGWLPVDKLGQILALIFVLGLVVCIVVGVIGCLKLLKRYLDDKIDLETTKWAHELEREKNEDENWRQVPGALQKRIKELEKTCKSNQETISDLKYEIEKKKQFMDQMKVSDLYKKWREEDEWKKIRDFVIIRDQESKYSTTYEAN